MALLLDELLRVKRIREDEAIKVMQEKQLQLEQCQKFLEAKTMEHDEYATWREREEGRLYEEVLHKVIRAYNLNVMRDQITSFKEKQQELKDEIEKAQAEVTEATKHLAEARRARMDAYKTVQKYEEYRDIIQTMEDQEAERREELETEEFSVRTVH